jgi:hypothetical protein
MKRIEDLSRDQLTSLVRLLHDELYDYEDGLVDTLDYSDPNVGQIQRVGTLLHEELQRLAINYTDKFQVLTCFCHKTRRYIPDPLAWKTVSAASPREAAVKAAAGRIWQQYQEECTGKAAKQLLTYDDLLQEAHNLLLQGELYYFAASFSARPELERDPGNTVEYTVISTAPEGGLALVTVEAMTPEHAACLYLTNQLHCSLCTAMETYLKAPLEHPLVVLPGGDFENLLAHPKRKELHE